MLIYSEALQNVTRQATITRYMILFVNFLILSTSKCVNNNNNNNNNNNGINLVQNILYIMFI